MGLRGDLKGLAEEYRRDPSGQYKRHLLKILNLHTTGGMSKAEVVVFVKDWATK
jgi:hypothetical protein